MKATEQYFPVVLCIMLYKVALTFEPVCNFFKCNHWNEFKAIQEQRIAVELFIILHKVFLICKSDEILSSKCAT